MARESKRTRDERRFGKPESMIDLATTVVCRSPENIDFGAILRRAADSKIVNADNVVDYMDSFKHDKDWHYSDAPCVKLPFPSIFIEAKPPKERLALPGFHRFGMYIEEFSGSEVVEYYEHHKNSIQKIDQSNIEIDLLMLREKCAYANRFTLIASIDTANGIRVFYLGRGDFFVDKRGSFLRPPLFESAAGITMDQMKSVAYRMTTPVFMALSFMNCKNTNIIPVAPNYETNRARRKAGLKPFVRYHTINIEPMKKILKTEGNSEKEGLKKALHICRGHFSTYSEEKPLFGRIAGTFWVPSHVRGSIKEGVIVSDYNVKP